MLHKLWPEINKFVTTHILLFIFVLVLFAVSVLFGAITVQLIDNSQKSELYMYFNSFLSHINNYDLPDKSIAQKTFWENIKYLCVLWVLGLSVIGLPVIVIMLFAKGFSIGFTVAFFIEQYSFKGFQLAIATILPHNLIIVPVIMFVGVFGIVFSMQLLVKERRTFKREKDTPKFSYYFITILVSTILILIASCYEAYIAPVFFKFIQII